MRKYKVTQFTHERKYEYLLAEIYHGKSHLDNPDNWWHDRYQRVVNRATLVTVVAMIMIMSAMNYGWSIVPIAIAAIVIGMAVAYVLYQVLGLLVWISANIAVSFISWITGE